MFSNFYVCEKTVFRCLVLTALHIAFREKEKTFVHIKKMHTKVFLYSTKGLQGSRDNRYEYFVLLLYRSRKRNSLRILYILLASPGA